MAHKLGIWVCLRRVKLLVTNDSEPCLFTLGRNLGFNEAQDG